MNSIDVIRQAFEGSHMWYQGTISGVSAEQANQIPAGVTHPIGDLAVHILHCEDGIINMVVQGKPMVWESDGWGEKLGIPLMMDLDPGIVRNFKCDPEALQEYAQAVYKSTAAFFSGLQPGDLENEVDMTDLGMGKVKLGEFLVTMLLGNNYAHTGEISALKGIMGDKGYPF